MVSLETKFIIPLNSLITLLFVFPEPQKRTWNEAKFSILKYLQSQNLDIHIWEHKTALNLLTSQPVQIPTALSNRVQIQLPIKKWSFKERGMLNKKNPRAISKFGRHLHNFCVIYQSALYYNYFLFFFLLLDFENGRKEAMLFSSLYLAYFTAQRKQLISLA